MKTLKFPVWLQSCLPPKDTKIQDRALKFTTGKDSWVKLHTLKMTLKFPAYTIKH